MGWGFKRQVNPGIKPMKRYRLLLGILLLLGSRLLPQPTGAAVLLLSGWLIVSSSWSSDRGPRKWWSLSCAVLAILTFVVLNLLGQDQVLVRRLLGALFLMSLVAGLVPTSVDLARVSRGAVRAIVDGVSLVRAMKRSSTGAP